MPTLEERLVERSSVRLEGDLDRVLPHFYVPGQETLIEGDSRARAVLDRVMTLDDAAVERALARVETGFATRFRGLGGILERHFATVEHLVTHDGALAPERRRLIGAYFTREFSLESAALFNPSMVEHPDQSGVDEGSVRFLMSVRAVGEGHISSIGFREGTAYADGSVVVEPAPPVTWEAYRSSSRQRRQTFERQLEQDGGATESEEHVLAQLPSYFSNDDLESVLSRLSGQWSLHENVDTAMARLRYIARCNYAVEFPDSSSISERVLWPVGPSESHGMEDARFVRFTDDEGTVRYLGSYTAFDGRHVVPQMVVTERFRRFEIEQLSGPAARNKGLAVFPRRIDGRVLALSRWNRETNDIAYSDDGRHWCEAVTVQGPREPWELVQLGNCGPPIETAEGWLVLTHGVGPMRAYSMGALLLDLADPSRVIGVLPEPILSADEDERRGYVPNVVYSCGALAHGNHLVVPYGCSDHSIRIAIVDLPGLLSALSPSRL